MTKHPRQEMVKATLWMHRDEKKKIAELSGDLSLNLFIMRAVRKQIALAEEQEQKGVRRSQATNQVSDIRDTTASDSDPSGESKSNEQ